MLLVVLYVQPQLMPPSLIFCPLNLEASFTILVTPLLNIKPLNKYAFEKKDSQVIALRLVINFLVLCRKCVEFP